MIKPHRDCFTTSVAEKLKWFKQCLWDGELTRGASLALEEILHGCLEEDIRSQIGVGRHERGVERLDLFELQDIEVEARQALRLPAEPEPCGGVPGKPSTAMSISEIPEKRERSRRDPHCQMRTGLKSSAIMAIIAEASAVASAKRASSALALRASFCSK